MPSNGCNTGCGASNCMMCSSIGRSRWAITWSIFMRRWVGWWSRWNGSQHFEAAAMRADECRSDALRRMGLEVLRFDNRQVLLETDAVVEEIWRFIDARIERA